MEDNINAFHHEAFAEPEELQADIESSYEKASYSNPLRTQGLETGKYTSGDTKYEPEHPLPDSIFVALPSKVSKRYSPQTKEQNTGAPLPPEPSFLKMNSGQPERITSVRNLRQKELGTNNDVIKSAPLPGVDFARTHSEAAALLERLGKAVSFEAHHSSQISANRSDGVVEKRINVEPNDRIVLPEQRQGSSQEPLVKIVVSSLPDKKYDNINLSPVGHDAIPIEARSIKTEQTFVATRKTREENSVSSHQVLQSEPGVPDAVVPQSQSTQPLNTFRKPANKSQNLINLMEDKLVNREEEPEIHEEDDAPRVIRKVMDDFVQMKKKQVKDNTIQMKTIETKVKKIIQSELPPEELESDKETVKEIKQIIKEVVDSHPNIIQRKLGNDDVEFSLAARDAFLRVQIEQELRDKFESRLVENNKLMEKQSVRLFESMIHDFLNP